jgi:hypothetical protein
MRDELQEPAPDPERDSAAVRLMLATEVERLEAQRPGCPDRLRGGVDFFVRMAQAVLAGGTDEAARAALIAIRESRAAGFLRELPGSGTASASGGSSASGRADDTTRVQLPPGH